MFFKKVSSTVPSGKTSDGFSLVEMMVVALLIVAIIGGIYLIFSAGQASWFVNDAKNRLQDNLRQTLQRISQELRQSKADQQFVFDGTGVNGTDVIRFSIPILCDTDSTFINSSGSIPYWGAPLTWGCANLTCMDANQDCGTLEYKYIEYLIDGDQRLRREVLDESLNLVKSDIFAENISDFQITVDGSMVHITATAELTTVTNQLLSASADRDIYLRN